MILAITIPGEPVAKARPRVTRAGITYTPAKTVNYETLVKELFHVAYPDHRPLDVPVKMLIEAYFTIPASWSKKKKQQALGGAIRPTKRPDWDNLGKLVSDALNGLAYRDDAQIVEATAAKYYSDRPRVEIEITEVEAWLGTGGLSPSG